MNVTTCLGLLSIPTILLAQNLDSRLATVRPRVVESGPDFMVWQEVKTGTAPDGTAVPVTNRWTELATGLTYFDQARQGWVPTVEGFEVSASGEAVAQRGPHRLTVKPNIRSWGAIDLRTSDGSQFRSHLLGLAYTDPATGRSALIAEPKDSVGTLTSENRIVWQDALTDVKADIRLTYTKAGVEHDVVLLEAPPSPTVFGLPENSMLEVWHEVVEAPLAASSIRAAATNGPARATNLAAQPDETLRIGDMTMGRGRAFSIAPDADASGLPALRGEGTQVRKSLQTLEGRRFLVEAVDYPAVRSELEQLPAAGLPMDQGAAQAGTPLAALSQRVRPGRVFPAGPARSEQPAQIQVAQVATPERGFVLDYAVLNSTANVTLKSDTTYHVSSVAILTGVTTLEGTVVKFSNDAQIQIAGTLRCLTGPYSQAIFTSCHDNTSGQTLPNSSGNPWTTHCAANALYFDAAASEVRHVRILHAKQGVYYGWNAGGPHLLTHVQFLHCEKAVVAHSTTVNVRNALMQDVGTAFCGTSPGYPATANVEHLTATNIYWWFNGPSQLTLNVTNSLLVNVTLGGTISQGFTVVNPPNPEKVFQTCGAGNYYLPAASPYRGTATPNVSQALKQDFAQMTTTAPSILNQSVGSALTLAPSVSRDPNATSPGYHYPALDFVASNVVLTAALTLKDGVAIAVTGSYGFKLDAGASFISEGTVPNLNRLVHYQTVQEQPNTWSVNSMLWLISSTLPTVQLRLTEIDGRAATVTALLDSSYAFQRFSLLDCQLRRTRLSLSPPPITGNTPQAVLTNNLVERSQVTFYHSYGSLNTPFTVQLFNNLFIGGTLWLSYDSSPPNPTWIVRDNLFDQTTQTLYGNAWAASIAHSHNAYTVGSVSSLDGQQAVFYSRDFQSGPLGPYYYPAAGASPSLASLADAGSRSASLAGLFHHTVRVDQTKDSGNVAIGFHYLAASPAEVEIPKSTMTADCSSSGYGWLAAYAIDGSTADPGWHNTTATEEPAWLRIDLHARRAVSRVGYVSRTGTANNFNGGQSNGAFREYRVYVTDDPSPNVSAWGNPVASGYWNWPNGQERRDVSFEPKCGRYVIFRRISASGYGSPPGYANVNEVWVTALGSTEMPSERIAVAQAIDTDNDGVCDYKEDSNGNGAYDPNSGETDWHAHEVFTVTSAQLETASFDHEHTRDIFTPVYEDGPGQVTEELHRRRDAFWQLTGRATRTISGFATWNDHGEVTEYTPASDTTCTYPGGFVEYHSNGHGLGCGPSWRHFDETATYTDGIESLYEHEYSAASVTLFPGGRFSLLYVPARQWKWGTATVYPPYYWPPKWGVNMDSIPFDKVAVDGIQVNADDCVLLCTVPGTPIDATPRVTGYDDYSFDEMTPKEPIGITLSRAYHPSFGAPPSLLALQAAFDAGSLFLGRDEDAKLRDSEVEWSDATGSVYRNDDVPAYVQFTITGDDDWFSEAFLSDDFYDIVSKREAGLLLAWRDYNIKQVHSIRFEGVSVPILGAGVASYPPTMLVLGKTAANVVIHEFLHTRGVDDRGGPNNPGNPAGALMNVENEGGTKINRSEREQAGLKTQ